jgi:hypothetical protein
MEQCFTFFQGLFIARCFEYSTFKNYDGSRNWWIMLARACGKKKHHIQLFFWIIKFSLQQKHTKFHMNYFSNFSGQCLNFTSMFILVVMLRHSITKLREMGLAVLLPLDKHIYFHKITGRLIVIYSLLHTAMHLGNLCK